MRIRRLVEKAKRFSREKYGEVEKNECLSAGYIAWGIDTSDGLAKSLHIVNFGNLLAGNMFRLVTWEKENGIRRKIHQAKHYIVYPETIQRRKDLNTDIRRMARVGV